MTRSHGSYSSSFCLQLDLNTTPSTKHCFTSRPQHNCNTISTYVSPSSPCFPSSSPPPHITFEAIACLGRLQSALSFSTTTTSSSLPSHIRRFLEHHTDIQSQQGFIPSPLSWFYTLVHSAQGTFFPQTPSLPTHYQHFRALRALTRELTVALSLNQTSHA